MRNLDAMGYNAVSTDPLYKHIPFTITRRDDVSFGLFYDNLSSCWLDLGNEIDNYHTAYRRWQAEAGDIDYYLFTGERVLDITKAFVRLTGKTLFGPKWSLGYSGSTMHYTDAPDAQNQLMNFIRLCEEHAIPCDSFQLSSGYTSINGKRYVFNWNYDKVPQPKVMSQAFHDAGLHLAANIKPCLLQDHPRYNEVAERGLFIRDSEADAPERSSFWDDEGSHLDFTNPQTVAVVAGRRDHPAAGDGYRLHVERQQRVSKYGTAKPAVTGLVEDDRDQTYSPGDAAADDARVAGGPAALSRRTNVRT